MEIVDCVDYWSYFWFGDYFVCYVVYVFVLFGFIMVGWWLGFLYWIILVICLVGGIFGVMYLILLCWVFVIGLDFFYLEGVVGVEVFKVGDFVGVVEVNKVGL